MRDGRLLARQFRSIPRVVTLLVSAGVLMSATNRLLATLPRDELQRLQRQLEPVRLPKGKILYEAGDPMHHAYFPLNGMVSLLAATHEGRTVEVAMVGNEGVVGLPIVLRAATAPYRVMVQIAGDAMRARSETLAAEFRRSADFQDSMLRYTHSLVGQIAQSAVCHRFHGVLERLSRWLLIAHDRVEGDTIELTQEFIAHMLGMPRTGVTAAAVELQDAGVIRYRHGRITILNRKRLEAESCECYRIVRDAIGQFPPAVA
jgi:CRP-like cAMP-binding protein